MPTVTPASLPQKSSHGIHEDVTNVRELDSLLTATDDALNDGKIHGEALEKIKFKISL